MQMEEETIQREETRRNLKLGGKKARGGLVLVDLTAGWKRGMGMRVR